LKPAWRNLEAKFEKLARRERALVLFGGIAVVLIVGFSVLDSGMARQRLLGKQLSQVQTETNLARAQAAQLQQQLAQDPDAAAREQIRGLRDEIAAIDAQLNDVHRGLVSPEGMARVLEDMLTRNRRVQLIGLKTLPVSTLTGEAISSQDRTGVYRHGVELTLEGSYLELLDYVSRLERLPWQMFWARADMDARDYPKVRLTLVVFTLSLDKKWMVV
jgi:MSHA biogenesis protein MshJ